MPLLWLSLAFLTGLLLGDTLHWSWSGWLASAAIVTVMAILARRATRDRFRAGILARFSGAHPILRISPAALLAAVLLGAARYQAAQPSLTPNDLAYYNGMGSARITGVVSAPPEPVEGAVRLRVQAREIAFADDPSASVHAVKGALLARVSPGREWRYGDLISLEGDPEFPPENEEFSYREYLARQGVYTYLGFARATWQGGGAGNPILGALYDLRRRSLETAARIFPPPEAALLSGILLGDESGITAEVEEAFQRTGTAHIVAISGFNVAILAGLFTLLFGRWLGARRGALAAALAIAAYAVLVGGQPPVVRASLMGGLALFGEMIGRRGAGANSLAFTAALMCLVNPSLPWDASFQLSFMATLGLVLYADRLQAGFLRLTESHLPSGLARRLAGPVGEYFLFTLAAQITTLPIMLYHFRRLSWVTLVANPLVLPPQPLVMVVGGLAVLAGLVWLPMGQALGALAWPFAAYTIRVVELLGRLPGASLALGGITSVGAALFYALLFALTLRKFSAASLPARLAPVALVTVAALDCLSWQAAMAQPGGYLHMTLLENGAGMSLLVQAPDGGAILVGGGESPRRLSDALGRRLPFYARHLDVLMTVGSDKATLGALPGALEAVPAQMVLLGGDAGETGAARALSAALAKAGVPAAPAARGQTLALGEGVAMRVICAGPDGAGYALVWQDFRALIPGGCPAEEFTRLARAEWPAPVSALVVGEKQSEDADEWVELLRPQAVLAAGQAGIASAIETARHGWVQITTDGRRMWVEVDRK